MVRFRPISEFESNDKVIKGVPLSGNKVNKEGSISL